MSSQDAPSSPRKAVLQGLKKMRALMDLGLTQGVLPPHERPHLGRLRVLGFTGSDAAIVEKAAKTAPALLRNVSSASAMWTANAATVSASLDTGDGRVHFTPANLAAMYHRALEPDFTGRTLTSIFADDAHFAHHPPVPGGGAMGDEGAANFGRLGADHDRAGVSLFVYGRSAFERLEGWRFAPRQALEASEAVARAHGVTTGAVFARQSRRAIEAGAFHNDVVSVANGPVLFAHEAAFEDRPGTEEAIRRAAAPFGFEPQFVTVSEKDVPLEDAIRSYLFNSQLITLPDGTMALILPGEVEETPTTRAYIENLISGNGPIRAAHIFDLKESMRNGGGPACLRLRVPLSEEALGAVAPGAILTEERLTQLEAWADQHYRDRLHPDDLGDPQLLVETREALDALTGILGLGSLYDFQR